MNRNERWVMRQLLNQWAHPEFASIKGFSVQPRSRQRRETISTGDWTVETLPSWIDSIVEGIRRPWEPCSDLGKS